MSSSKTTSASLGYCDMAIAPEAIHAIATSVPGVINCHRTYALTINSKYV
ncbi:MAG: hypothetical protein HWQ41_01830 [Nostoc sp. NOS(2021)]|nr:hypothetical protein [Nostoc sp. NOS(2021)]MBN3894068.1 hypothetical protein [Nostoc sp. NOS(2021)]